MDRPAAPIPTLHATLTCPQEGVTVGNQTSAWFAREPRISLSWVSKTVKGTSERTTTELLRCAGFCLRRTPLGREFENRSNPRFAGQASGVRSGCPGFSYALGERAFRRHG